MRLSPLLPALFAIHAPAQHGTQCVHWVETGVLPVGISRDGMLAGAVRNGEGEAIALTVASMAEDLEQSRPVRNRAVELLLAILVHTEFAGLAEDSRRQLTRAMVHATTDSGLEPRLRGYSIAATAWLSGMPERLDWLLEGQVQLRRLLDPKQKEAWPDAELQPGLLAYFGRLGKDGVPAFDLLLDLFERDAVTARARPELQHALVQLAPFVDAPRAARSFACFARALDPDTPHVARGLAKALQMMLSRSPEVLADPAALESASQLVERVAAWLRGKDAPATNEGGAVTMLHALYATVPQLDDEDFRRRLLDRGRAAVRPLADHRDETVRQMAREWLQQ